jgi:hypothetical protein
MGDEEKNVEQKIIRAWCRFHGEAEPSALMYDVRLETRAGKSFLVLELRSGQPCYTLCLNGVAEPSALMYEVVRRETRAGINFLVLELWSGQPCYALRER